MAIAKLIQQYRKSINPPYSRKDAAPILATLFILVVIPLIVFIILSVPNGQPQAAPSGPPRGVAGDLWADVIIGKPDFSEITPYEVVPYKVANPGGVIVDRSVSPGRAYVWDSENSRILGLDLAKCYSGTSACTADIVIGQPSGYDHSACNGDSGFQNYPNRASANASTLCGIPENTQSPLEHKSFVSMAVDSSSNLYVPDAFNHRVLKYINPFTTDTVADEVWGQADFSGNTYNRGASPTASSLCFGGYDNSWGFGVEIDSSGNLWVADGGNNRVLRFPKNPTTGEISKTADLVLGQPGFTTRDMGHGMNQMEGPNALRFDHNGWLYEVESTAPSGHHRVLVFKPPFVSGMSANNTFASGLNGPSGIEMDPAGGGVWVFEHKEGRIRLWDFDGVTVKKDLKINQNGGGSLGIDTNGNILASAYVYGQDVYRFALQPDGSYLQDKRLFSPPYGYNKFGSKGLSSGGGVEVTAGQLIVADRGRLLFWNNPNTLTNGKPADGFVGVRDFETSVWDCCGRLRADDAGHLYVQAGFVIKVYQLPLSIGSKPIKTLKFPFTTLEGDQISAPSSGAIVGIAPVGNGEFLWLSHSETHRVFRIRDPLTNPVVDVILGQKDVNGTTCNRGQVPESPYGPAPNLTADMLCWPGAVALDRLGNLFVSDHALEVHGNGRLLEFNASLFPTNNTTTIFAPSAKKIFPGILPWEPAFDSQNRMVVGYNVYSGKRFVGVYNDPLGPSTTPDTYLKDYWSMPYATAFDKYDNLYIGDLNRSRVLIYKDPFNNNPNIPPDPPIPEVTTINTKISISSDDAFNGCSLETAAIGVSLGLDQRCTPAKPITTGLRFQNLAIPQGATITNAVISFVSSADYTNPLSLIIKGAATDNSPTFSSSNNPATASTTTASVPFNIGYPWQWKAHDFTPNFAFVVQEIVNRPGWQAGNSLAVIIKDNGSASERRFDGFNIDPTGTAELWVQYTTASDNQYPTISITSPTAGALLKGSVNVAASANDNVGVTKVELYVDGTLNGEDSTTPYSFSWDTTTATNASHTLTTKAYDAAGNAGVSSNVTVTIDNQPPTTPTGLTATVATYNQVNLVWNASSDNVAVTGYWIVRNSTPIASSTTNNYTDNTVSLSTTYNYQVIAYDSAGNISGPSNTATTTTPATPDTSPPTAPANLVATAISSSQINLSWTASTDNIGVTGYDVYNGNNIKIATVTTTSYGDTGLAASTPYSYYVKAFDAAGNNSAASNTASATTFAPPVSTGNITGTVFSSAGGVVGSAKVSLTVNGSKKTYITNSLGVYTITNLPAGTYSLKFSAQRYISQTVSGTVTASTTVTKNLTLQKR